MAHLLGEDSPEQGDATNLEISHDHLGGTRTVEVTLDVGSQDRNGRINNYQIVWRKEVLTDMTYIAGTMIWGVEARLSELVRKMMENNLEQIITEYLTEEHHRNPFFEAIKDFLRSPEETYLSGNALTKTEGVL